MGVNVFCKCHRCNGNGIIKAFMHVKAGVCFGCRLNAEDTAAPGSFEGVVTFDGKFVTLRDRPFIRMSDLAKLSRKEKIAQAAKWVNELSVRGPRGRAFIELVALARVSDAVLAGRILAALRQRVAGNKEEVREVEGLVREFGLEAAASASV